MESFQLYLSRYPNSSRKEQINEYMDEMRDKLSYKDYLSARNYYLREKYKSAVVSSNKLIGHIIRKHPVGRKYEIEQLMSGEKVHKKINENITFQYLDGDENSLWSLLLSVGYIKAENVVHKVDTIECDVSVTNKEVMAMFRTEILGLIVTLRDSG